MKYQFDGTFACYKKGTPFDCNCHGLFDKVCGGLGVEDFDQDRGSTIFVLPLLATSVFCWRWYLITELNSQVMCGQI